MPRPPHPPHPAETEDALARLAGALRGRFVVFEGPDGSGKTTQLRMLEQAMATRGLATRIVRDPGGTHAGERIRELLLDPDTGDIAVACEMLLYMASRAQLCQEVIRPALDAGELVFADRFVSSTIAYQGGGGGLAVHDIEHVARVATAGARPDLVIIFDVDAKTAATRLNPLLDRMEAKGAEFHARVRASYHEQANADPAHHLVIDATPETAAVFASLVAQLAARLAPTP